MGDFNKVIARLNRLAEDYTPVPDLSTKDIKAASKAAWAAINGAIPYVDWELIHKAYDNVYKTRTGKDGSSALTLFADDGSLKPGITPKDLEQYKVGYSDFAMFILAKACGRAGRRFDDKASAMAKISAAEEEARKKAEAEEAARLARFEEVKVNYEHNLALYKPVYKKWMKDREEVPKRIQSACESLFKQIKELTGLEYAVGRSY